MKFRVRTAPSGAVSYVSGGWGGRASDQKITSECGLLDELQAGQDVMADRGFIVESLFAVWLSPHYSQLLRPSPHSVIGKGSDQHAAHS